MSYDYYLTRISLFTFTQIHRVTHSVHCYRHNILITIMMFYKKKKNGESIRLVSTSVSYNDKKKKQFQ